MAITGTGTQVDPYVVTTWAELASKTSETDVYIKLGNNIDMNTEYPEGLTSGLTVNCAQIDGDGKTVKNLYLQSGALITCAGRNSTWKNTELLNWSIGNGSNAASITANGNTSGTYTFNRCKLSGRLNGGSGNSTSFLAKSGRIKFYRSSINFQMTANASTIDMSGDWRNCCTMEYCNVNFTGETAETLNIVLVNSYIKGALASATLNATRYPDGQVSTYSVLDITAAAFTANSATNLVLANSEKCSSIGQYLTSVTTSQLTNATYLSGIGFPIQT